MSEIDRAIEAGLAAYSGAPDSHSNNVANVVRAAISAYEAARARASFVDGYAQAIEDATDVQPSIAEDPSEDAYQRGRFDGIMEYGKAIRALVPAALDAVV
jgi:hypothetical protein